VLLATGERFDKVDAVDGDRATDIAVLKIPGFGLPTLSVTAALPEVGARVVVIGSPLGLTHTVSEGIVSAVRLEQGRQLIQFTAPISPGSSGGPVLDANGHVVGIATSTLTEGQQLNFAVPVKYAMGLITSTRPTRPLSSVFASGDATAANGDETGGSSVPRRATSVRQDLSGSYAYHEALTIRQQGQPGRRSDRSGTAIVLADEGVILMPKAGPGNRDLVVILPSVMTSTIDGRVDVTVPGAADFDGYQTQSGFYIAASWEQPDHTAIQSSMTFVAQSTPLTAATGLYDVTSNARFTSRTGFNNGTIDRFVGRVGILTANDSVFVMMNMHSTEGAEMGISGKAPLGGGVDFAFTARNGSSLSGQVGGGHIRLDWVRMVNDGYRMIGTINGVRR
jgi:hypothetical protein